MIIETTTNENRSPVIEHFFSDLMMMAQSQINAQLRSKIDPGDLVQETMLEAYRDVEKFRGKSDAELRNWLRAILSNNLVSALRYHRRHKRNGHREVSLASGVVVSDRPNHYCRNGDSSSPWLMLVQQERSEELASALRRLRTDEQTVVVLKYLQNQSVAEIARHIGRTAGAVSGLLRRGMKKLRACFRE